MLIGICGRSGSGKSTIARAIAEEKNALHYEIDKIGHDVLTINEVQTELVKSFGDDIANGENIDRKRLGELVFTSREKMQTLTDITWRYMQLQIDSIIQNSQDKIVVLDWILLSQTKYFDMCDIKILVDVPYETRKQRAMQRDNITAEQFDLREQASVEYDKEKFDIVVNNNDINEIKKLVKQI
jgi:dephospho-CoA kinase